MDPISISAVDQFLLRAALGPVPGWVVVAADTLFHGRLLVLGFMPAYLQTASGEIDPARESYELNRKQASEEEAVGLPTTQATPSQESVEIEDVVEKASLPSAAIVIVVNVTARTVPCDSPAWAGAPTNPVLPRTSSGPAAPTPPVRRSAR